MSLSKEALKKAVTKTAADGKLSCEKAHALGRELGVSLREIGAVCDELGIKISACQLGCF